MRDISIFSAQSGATNGVGVPGQYCAVERLLPSPHHGLNTLGNFGADENSLSGCDSDTLVIFGILLNNCIACSAPMVELNVKAFWNRIRSILDRWAVRSSSRYPITYLILKCDIGRIRLILTGQSSVSWTRSWCYAVMLQARMRPSKSLPHFRYATKRVQRVTIYPSRNHVLFVLRLFRLGFLAMNSHRPYSSFKERE